MRISTRVSRWGRARLQVPRLNGAVEQEIDEEVGDRLMMLPFAEKASPGF